MRKVVLLILAFAMTRAAEAGVERREHMSYPTGSIRTVELQHALGDLEIEGYDGDEILVEMDVRCSRLRSRCEERASRVELRSRSWDGELRLSVDGYPRHGSGISVDLFVKMPRSMSVQVERGVGETSVSGLLGDIEIEAGVGEVRVTADEANVRSVRAQSGVGDSRVDAGAGRVRRDGFLFLANEVEWSGLGTARIDVEVGVGEVRVKLD